MQRLWSIAEAGDLFRIASTHREPVVKGDDLDPRWVTSVWSKLWEVLKQIRTRQNILLQSALFWGSFRLLHLPSSATGSFFWTLRQREQRLCCSEHRHHSTWSTVYAGGAASCCGANSGLWAAVAWHVPLSSWLACRPPQWTVSPPFYDHWIMRKNKVLHTF